MEAGNSVLKNTLSLASWPNGMITKAYHSAGESLDVGERCLACSKCL